ncbi:MAG: hypothetical protein M0Z75_12045 [Nitrospiraceae bacterium]|nr:hypothetical protein [Nitrospiraceae bacterium]
MEIGGLKKQDFEVWVPFGAEGDPAEVLVRYVSRAELQDIRKKATVTSWDRQHQKEERLDAVKADVLLGRAAVRDWKGFTMEGREYPYSPENCDELMRGWTQFARFVNEICVDLQALQEEDERRKIKNSSRISGTE